MFVKNCFSVCVLVLILAVCGSVANGSTSLMSSESRVIEENEVDIYFGSLEVAAGKLKSTVAPNTLPGRSATLLLELGTLGRVFTCREYCVPVRGQLFVRYNQKDEFQEIHGLPELRPIPNAKFGFLPRSVYVQLDIPNDADVVEAYMHFDRWSTRPHFNGYDTDYLYVAPIQDNEAGAYVSNNGKNFVLSLRD